MADAFRNYQTRPSLVVDNLEKMYESRPLNNGGADGTLDDMTERLAKLEGQFEGHKLVQTITMSVIAIVAAIVIASTVYLMTQVNQLPGKISADLRDLNQTMLQAVTASKQQVPQVILMPAPTIDMKAAPTPPPDAK